MKQPLLLSICLLALGFLLLGTGISADGVLQTLLTVVGIVAALVGAYLLGTQLRRAR